MKLSQWHDENVKPVHVGVYECKFNEKTYSFFDGNLWGYSSGDINYCLKPEYGYISRI